MNPILKPVYHWHAIYTKSRNEKKAFERLTRDGYDVYLPLISREKQWSDRKKRVEEPLFKSYMFVRVSTKEYYEILKDPAIVRYVSFEGKAAIVPDKQIDLIRSFMGADYPLESTHELIEPGSEVRIVGGPLMGKCGEMVKFSGSHRIIVRIDIIGQSLLVNIPHFLVENK